MGIRVKNINFSYGEKILIEEACFQIDDGQKVELVGDNGTGKFTSLKLFRSEENPDDGKLEIIVSMELVPREVKRDLIRD